MNITSADKLHFNIASFSFIFTPLQIASINRLPEQQIGIQSDKTYILQLQKGAQVIKRFSNKIQLNNTLRFYFNLQENVKLKIFNQKSSSHCLAIYKQQSWGLVYLESLKIQFLEAFLCYIKAIKHKATEFKAILEKIQQKEQFGTHWRQFKAGLSKHIQVFTTKNNKNLFELKYSIEIKSQIDYLAEIQQPKIKFKFKRSYESQKRSTSSKNSKQKNTQQNSISTLQKSKSELKFIEQNKSEIINKSEIVPQSPFQSENLKEKQFIQSLNPTEVTEQNQDPKIIPFIPLNSIIRKNQILSDIVEASYQGDSQMNSGGDQTDRKLKQMPQIKEQDEGNWIKRKTYHFQNQNDQYSVQIRRNNSLNNIRTASFLKQGESNKNIEDEDIQQEYERSQSNQIQHQKQIKNEKSITILVLLMLLIYTIITAEFLMGFRQLWKIGSFKKPKSKVILKTKI